MLDFARDQARHSTSAVLADLAWNYEMGCSMVILFGAARERQI
jgi:hypothetical protein